MPFGGLGHGFMTDQGFDDTPMRKAAKNQQRGKDDSDNGSGRH